MIPAAVLAAISAQRSFVLPRNGSEFNLRADSNESEPPIDLPLRDREPESGSEPGDGATRGADSDRAYREPPHHRGLTPFIGMLVLGLLAGFGAGFLVGQRLTPPSPPRAVEIPRPEPAVPAAPVVAPSPPVVEPAVVPAERVPEPPVAAVPAPIQEPEVVPPPPVQKPVARPAAPAVRPATVRFDSRPPGATIYLDETRVGVTPLTMENVPPGEHQVRLEMLGHDTWRTSVTVKEGEQYFLGASLE